MWVSQQGKNTSVFGTGAEEGQVTVGGDPAGVYLTGERRNLPVCAPGGFRWKPATGQQVLVLNHEQGGAHAAILGLLPQGDVSHLQSGEIELSGGGAHIMLGQSAVITLGGTVNINGEKLEDMIRRIVGEELAK